MQDLALVNCRVWTGARDDTPIDDGVVLIGKAHGPGAAAAGRIEAVGRSSEVSVPAGYTRIDLAGQYVLPGLINAHCHLLTSGKPMRLFRAASENEALMRRMVGLMRTRIGKRLALRMMLANVQNALHSGVTTLRAMSDLAWLDVKLRKRIDCGQAEGPRLLVSGQGICPTGGHGAYVGFVADSPHEVRRLVRANLREEVDWIKILSTGGVMDARKVGEAGQPQMTIDEIEAACTIAHRAGVMVATHCESTKGMEEALLGGVDTIEHGAQIDDALVPLFRHNPKALRGYTALIPTLSAAMGLATLPPDVTMITKMSFANAQIIGRQMILGLRRAYGERIAIGVGTDAGVPYVPHYEFWKELDYYVHYTGMSPSEAIHLATLGNARVLGIEAETGSIEADKSADMIVVKRNPLEDLGALAEVTHVFMRGRWLPDPRVKRIRALDAAPVTQRLEP